MRNTTCEVEGNGDEAVVKECQVTSSEDTSSVGLVVVEFPRGHLASLA